jgi:type I restriction enzyme S subunit
LPHAQRRLNAHNVGRGSARQTAAHAFHHLFPQAFEQSDEPSVGIQGWIPKGWGVSRLDSILELAYGRALKKTERLEGDIPVYGSGGMTGYHNDFLVPGPGIIVGRKGTVGSLYWEDKNFYPIDTVFYVKPMKQYSLEYCFMQLKVLGLENMNTDAAVPGLNRNNAYRLEIVKPEQKIIDKFSDIIKSFQCRKQALQSETENLESLRDTLLPKLISGELRIPDAEQATEALAK